MRFLLVTLITLVLTIAFFMLIILPLLEEKVKPRPLPSKPYTKTTNPPATQPASPQPKPTQDEVKLPKPGPDPELLEKEKLLPETWINLKDNSTMMLVRAGTFFRGADEQRNHRAEYPKQKIFVSSFYIDKYPITNSQFRKFIAAGGYETPEYWTRLGWYSRRRLHWEKPAFWGHREYAGPDKPVVGISWFEAEAYMRWAGKMLPTEVQWEKAARGYYGQKYPWGHIKEFGDKWIKEACNWADYDPNDIGPNRTRGCIDGWDKTASVFSYAKYLSPFGVAQMSGNVWQWCRDWWSPTFFSKTVAENPRMRFNPVNTKPLSSQPWRVIKGGAFDMPPDYCEPSYRNGTSPQIRQSTTGCRGVLSALVVLQEIKKLQNNDDPDK